MGASIGVDPLGETVAGKDVLLEDVGYNSSAAGESGKGLVPPGVGIQNGEDVAMTFGG